MPDMIANTSNEDTNTSSTANTSTSTGTSSALSPVLHKLAHDLRTPLSIIAMGIEAIRALKHDPAQLDAICDMMSAQGVEAIKQHINRMTELPPRD